MALTCREAAAGTECEVHGERGSSMSSTCREDTCEDAYLPVIGLAVR